MTSALGCCGHANTSSLRFNSSDVSGSDLITLGSFLNGENRPDSPSVHSLNLSNEHPNSALLGSFLFSRERGDKVRCCTQRCRC